MATSRTSPTAGEASGDVNTEPLQIAPPLEVSETGVDPANLAGAEPSQEGVHLKDIDGVRYIGTSDVRGFTVADFASVGVEAKDDLTWSSENDHFVPKSEINAATLAWLVSESDFRAE